MVKRVSVFDFKVEVASHRPGDPAQIVAAPDRARCDEPNYDERYLQIPQRAYIVVREEASLRCGVLEKDRVIAAAFRFHGNKFRNIERTKGINAQLSLPSISILR
jgi:hypothetical protein